MVEPSSSSSTAPTKRTQRASTVAASASSEPKVEINLLESGLRSDLQGYVYVSTHNAPIGRFAVRIVFAMCALVVFYDNFT